MIDRSTDYVNSAGVRRGLYSMQSILPIVSLLMLLIGSLAGVWYTANERLSKLEGVVVAHEKAFDAVEKRENLSILLNFTNKDAKVLINDIASLSAQSVGLRDQINRLKEEVSNIEREVFTLSAAITNLPPVEWQRMILENERGILNLQDTKK